MQFFEFIGHIQSFIHGMSLIFASKICDKLKITQNLRSYLSVALIVYLCRLPTLPCTSKTSPYLTQRPRCLARSVSEAYFRFIRRTVRMPGYDCLFLSGMDPQRCVCPLCRLPMRDPVIISSCGHRFCDVCLQEYFR